MERKIAGKNFKNFLKGENKKRAYHVHDELHYVAKSQAVNKRLSKLFINNLLTALARCVIMK